MEQEKKEMWQRILAHQLQGIMFHSEASLLYKLLGCSMKSHKHTVAAINETAMHHLTLMHIVEDYGEILLTAPGTVQRLSIFESDTTTAPADKEERNRMKKTIHDKYIAWEESTVKLYDESLALMPKCDILKKLRKASKNELSKLLKNNS